LLFDAVSKSVSIDVPEEIWVLISKDELLKKAMERITVEEFRKLLLKYFVAEENSFNPEDCANALEKLLTDEELWLKLSKNGQEFVKQFDHVKVAKEYEVMIEKVL
jgi:glycosyltransferase involved in cell wall biosynthesis